MHQKQCLHCTICCLYQPPLLLPITTAEMLAAQVAGVLFCADGETLRTDDGRAVALGAPASAMAPVEQAGALAVGTAAGALVWVDVRRAAVRRYALADAPPADGLAGVVARMAGRRGPASIVSLRACGRRIIALCADATLHITCIADDGNGLFLERSVSLPGKQVLDILPLGQTESDANAPLRLLAAGRAPMLQLLALPPAQSKVRTLWALDDPGRELRVLHAHVPSPCGDIHCSACRDMADSVGESSNCLQSQRADGDSIDKSIAILGESGTADIRLKSTSSHAHPTSPNTAPWSAVAVDARGGRVLIVDARPAVGAVSATLRSLRGYALLPSAHPGSSLAAWHPARATAETWAVCSRGRGARTSRCAVSRDVRAGALALVDGAPSIVHLDASGTVRARPIAP